MMIGRLKVAFTSIIILSMLVVGCSKDDKKGTAVSPLTEPKTSYGKAVSQAHKAADAVAEHDKKIERAVLGDLEKEDPELDPE